MQPAVLGVDPARSRGISRSVFIYQTQSKSGEAAKSWSAGDLARENTAAGSLPLQGK